MNRPAPAFETAYPRPPTADEETAIGGVVIRRYFGFLYSNRKEAHELRVTLSDAINDGRFIITHAHSDTPGYVGPIAIVIWPDTSVTMYRCTRMALPSFHLVAGDWYECDKDGIPWI